MNGTELAHFRAEVDRILKEREWKPARLARETSLNPGTVSKFLRGVGPHPRADTIMLIARALGISLDAMPAPASTPPPGPQDYVRGFREG